MQIIKPNERYIQSYYEACKATWETVHEKYIIHDPDKFDEWETHIIKDFEDAEKGINLPEGFIPNVTYWMVNDDEYIGTINIRLGLNDFLARYGGHYGIVIQPKYRGKGYALEATEFVLGEAKRRKLNPFLSCTQETNLPAIKTNEHFNPVKMEKEDIIHNGKPLSIRRYYFEF